MATKQFSIPRWEETHVHQGGRARKRRRSLLGATQGFASTICSGLGFAKHHSGTHLSSNKWWSKFRVSTHSFASPICTGLGLCQAPSASHLSSSKWWSKFRVSTHSFSSQICSGLRLCQAPSGTHVSFNKWWSKWLLVPPVLWALDFAWMKG